MKWYIWKTDCKNVMKYWDGEKWINDMPYRKRYDVEATAALVAGILAGLSLQEQTGNARDKHVPKFEPETKCPECNRLLDPSLFCEGCYTP